MMSWGRQREVEKSKSKPEVTTWKDPGNTDCVLTLERDDDGESQVWLGLHEPTFIVGLGATPEAAKKDAVETLRRFADAANSMHAGEA